MLQVLKKLDQEQIKQIREYLHSCYHQNNELDTYIDEVNQYYDAELSPYYVGTLANQITGLMILDEVDDEIVYGRIFTRDTSFLEEIEAYFTTVQITTLVLETPNELPQHPSLNFDYAEYMMALQPSRIRETLGNPCTELKMSEENISLHEITSEDRNFYENILESQYKMEKEEANERFDSLLSEVMMHGFLVYLNGNHPVGIGSYYEGDTFITLFDLTILPEVQGCGYGKAMLFNLLSQNVSKNKKILLQVTSSNTPAYQLYQQVGFEIIEQQCFYCFELK